MDAGEQKPQIVTGLKPYYKPEELDGKKIIWLSNLKPAKLRGVESQGMLLAAEHEKDVRVFMPVKSNPGDSVLPVGYEAKKEIISHDRFKKLNKLNLKDKKLHLDNLELKTENEEMTIDMPDDSIVT